MFPRSMRGFSASPLAKEAAETLSAAAPAARIAEHDVLPAIVRGPARPTPPPPTPTTSAPKSADLHLDLHVMEMPLDVKETHQSYERALQRGWSF